MRELTNKNKDTPSIMFNHMYHIYHIYHITESKLSSLGPIYYEYGSMVVEFDSSSNAIAAFEILKHKIYKDKRLLGNYMVRLVLL